MHCIYVRKERILLIRGLGLQYTQLNCFSQETCTFYPLEQVESVHIFESFDGLKVTHFLNVKMKKGGNGNGNENENVLLFEVKMEIDFFKI